MAPSADPSRYHALDAARATALLLGVFLHASIAYLPVGADGWAVRDRSTHALFVHFVLVVHSFRLGIFFILAGFFARLSLQRRGWAPFVQNRLQRIALPFLVGWAVLYPAICFVWTWGYQHGDPGALGQATAAIVFGPLDALRKAVRNPGYFPLIHLWFLYYLLLLYLLALGVRAGVLRFGRFAAALVRAADGVTRFVVGRAWAFPLLVAATGFVLLGMKEPGVDTPDRTLVPHGWVLLLYGAMFALGWFLHRQSDLLVFFRRRWALWLTVALLVTLLVGALIGLNPAPPAPPGDPSVRPFRFIYALLMWSWIFALFGVFLRFLDEASARWKYLADASYWVYLVHLPVVVLIQVPLSRTDLHCAWKFILSSLVTLLLCLVSYQLFVRSTWLGRALHGTRQGKGE